MIMRNPNIRNESENLIYLNENLYIGWYNDLKKRFERIWLTKSIYSGKILFECRGRQIIMPIGSLRLLDDSFRKPFSF